MTKVNIKYLWWIEDEKYWASLTWSATLMNAEIYWWIKILFDYWMFQWWKNEDLLNNKTDEEAINADYIVITHSHMDHIGRLPLLIKKWFKWKIFMSNLTKQLMVVMLSDYVKLTTDKIESLEKENKAKWLKIRKYLKAIKLKEELLKNGLTKKDKDKKNKSFNKIIWNENEKKFLKTAYSHLKKFNIESESDIKEELNSDIPTLLYNMEDIFSTMNMVETLEIWNEIDLTDHIVITRENSEVIDRLPLIVKKEWYNKFIYVTPDLRVSLIHKWKNEIDSIFNISKLNKELRESLINAFTIYNEKEKYINDNKYIFEEAKNLLEKYSINSKKDIEELKSEIPELPYNKEDLEKAISLLKVAFNNPNEKVVESFKLKFANAGHIEWSVQAIVTLVTKQVEQTIGNNISKANKWKNKCYWNINKEYQNFLFTWDLGKISDPNISWIPDIPDYKFEYVQCESTYATREHPNKQEEFKNFINEINSTKWKVLIPAFSLQRTQEVMLELLENKKNNLVSIKKISKLEEEYKKISKKYKVLLDKWNDLTWKEKIEKSDLFSAIAKLDELKNSYKINNFTWDLLIDSPLSRKVKDIYLENIWDKYKLLDPLIQKWIFWKEVVRNLERWEYKNLYTEKRKRSKDVIISSWGMLQWWAIINHLKEIITDPNAKIIFTWYQSPYTLWWKILSWDKQIIIEWEIFPVKCEVRQIRWYSSHIWGNDIVDYVWKKINFSKNGILALNHWGELRWPLSEIIKGVNNKIEVIVPWLYDTVTVWL